MVDRHRSEFSAGKDTAQLTRRRAADYGKAGAVDRHASEFSAGEDTAPAPIHIRRSAPGDARPMLGNTERNWLGIRQTLSLAYFRGRYVSAGSSGGDGGVVGRQCWWGSIHRGGRTCGVPSRMRMFQPLVSR